MEPFPPLPVELVRWIMEIAAKGDPDTSYALICVSTLVHKWIIPILYHSVVMETPDQLQPFKDALHAHGAHVRRLCISHSPDMTVADSVYAGIICGCPRLEALCSSVDIVAEVSESTSFPRLWMIVVDVYIYARLPPPGHPLLQNVTHLHIEYLDESYTSTIAALPRLTHIGIDCYGDEDSAQLGYISWIHRLLSSPSLRILLMCAFQSCGDPTTTLLGKRWHQLSKITDVRLLVREGLYREDHISTVLDGESLWDGVDVHCKNWREEVVSSESP